MIIWPEILAIIVAIYAGILTDILRRQALKRINEPKGEMNYIKAWCAELIWGIVFVFVIFIALLMIWFKLNFVGGEDGLS